MNEIHVQAICPLLNERDLFTASVAAIYPFVDGITVATAVHSDWAQHPVKPDGLINDLIDGSMDPAGKMIVLVIAETNQARVINRVMDLHTVSVQHRVAQQHPLDRPPSLPDYFWLFDADELWDEQDIRRAFEVLRTHRYRYVQTPAQHYFKTWNYRVTGFEWFTTFVRADCRVHNMRNPNLLRPWTKALWRVPHMPPGIPLRTAGIHRLQPSTARFHHGSYVGPRSRMVAKVGWSPHNHQMGEGWVENVWDPFTVDSVNLHPTEPSAFAAVEYVPTDQLPVCISRYPWPDGYLG